MNFLKYKKLIESKGIELFDHEYRISYHNITNMRRISAEQTGGGSLYKTLKNKDSNNLLNIVKMSISDTNCLISLLA
jgi:hypothetical protein